MREEILSEHEILRAAEQYQFNREFRKAENLYKTILSTNPQHYLSLVNLALCVQEFKQYELAQNLLLSATKAKPRTPTAYFHLGNLFYGQNILQKAINCYQITIQLNPNFSPPYHNLGDIYSSLGMWKEATKSYNNALTKSPNSISTIYGLGKLFHQIGQLDKAVTYYQQAIELEPNNLNVLSNLARALSEQRKYSEAITNFQRALKIDSKSFYTIANLATLFKNIDENILLEKKQTVQDLLLLLYEYNYIDHNDIFRISKFALLSKERIKTISLSRGSKESLFQDKNILLLFANRLFQLMLQKCFIVDKLMENFLCWTREWLLLQFTSLGNIDLNQWLDFIISLAHQCFLNEYVYFQTDQEEKLIGKLKNMCEKKEQVDVLEITLLGCYIPLNSSQIIRDKLVNYQSQNGLFNNLISLQIREPIAEKTLAKSINSVGKITDHISEKVSLQYEENPYPRWRFSYIEAPGTFVQNLNYQIYPNFMKNPPNFQVSNSLIAGCGTGKHILSAQSYLGKSILAIDLSMASLSYAKRKTDELGLSNIEYLHCDILELEQVDRQFDVIESLGVLHHMDDPLAGLKVLVTLLKPNGFLKLGVYSKIARKPIFTARKFINKNGLKDNIEDIRKFRKIVFEEGNLPCLSKLLGQDFYTVSSVRDLLFHVKEHQFDLLTLKDVLGKFKLNFLGFSIDQSVKEKYSAYYPQDKRNTSLQYWHEFEKREPETFLAMYQFWVQKVGN